MHRGFVVLLVCTGCVAPGRATTQVSLPALRPVGALAIDAREPTTGLRPLRVLSQGANVWVKSIEGATFLMVEGCPGRTEESVSLRLKDDGTLDRSFAHKGTVYGRYPAPLFFDDGRTISRWDGMRWTRRKAKPSTVSEWLPWNFGTWIRLESDNQAYGVSIVLEGTDGPPPDLVLPNLSEFTVIPGASLAADGVVVLYGQSKDPSGDLLSLVVLRSTTLGVPSSQSFSLVQRPRTRRNRMWFVNDRGDVVRSIFGGVVKVSEPLPDDEYYSAFEVDEEGNELAVGSAGGFFVKPKTSKTSLGWALRGSVGAAPRRAHDLALSDAVYIAGEGALWRWWNDRMAPVALPPGIGPGWDVTLAETDATGRLYVYLEKPGTDERLVLTNGPVPHPYSCAELIGD